MLGDKSQTPTRHELLSMVKKHSKLILDTTLDEDETSADVEMDSGFWHDIIDLYFVSSRESRGREDDDLVFFVRKTGLHAQRPSDSAEANSPYFVRRWAPKLDDLVGDNSTIIDWRRSFYLNLIAHTTFSVTVAICSHQVLRQYHASQGKTLSPIYKVLKTVYASPSRINFHLDSRKEVETTPAYPEICFAVDDFDSTFDAVVLTDTDHCYCVLLNAHDGAAFPRDTKTEQVSSDVSSSDNAAASAGKIKKSKITLFSGFVSYQMVREAYDAGRTGFGSLLSLGHSSGRTDRIYMKGPGGRGEVEVAVSGVLDQSKTELGPHSPIQIPKKGLGIGTMVRTAASVASTAAKNAYAAASSTRPSDEEMLPLKCCLMSISLPWENIAHDLLFKGSPPVNL
ncbi:hypothetical protein ABFS82_03G031700 [Erythranthe guttata]|uniref:Uncharacterized protein n=1 Tax=Erythranthe guttata TaxID=4155 RepID=A0A022QWW9_ERYGU|nr:PREDICTED: uncharacterized protein KIAA0930 homolog [Erythranthe guttata]EYU32381.1 hypothetical protein MIMGU_mgv1a007750mg [Erythranthe guttata]|eukprot:XP_012843387.1 PREDICTED: uncharacterized protein KIAA0930 homolog [Erythranthe guttata]